MNNAKIIRVIETKSTAGEGTKENPARLIIQYWDLKGRLLFTHDTLTDNRVISSR